MPTLHEVAQNKFQSPCKTLTIEVEGPDYATLRTPKGLYYLEESPSSRQLSNSTFYEGICGNYKVKIEVMKRTATLSWKER